MYQTSVNLMPCSINTHQGPSGTKVPRLEMFRSILSLIKTAHQIWLDHQLSQRNKTTERAVGVGVGGDSEVRGGDGIGQILKRG